MRVARLVAGLMLALAGIGVQAQSAEQEISASGKLVRMMAIGAESTGWAIELDPSITVGGKQIASLQVRYSKTKKLEKLANKHVAVTGHLGQKTGAVTGHLGQKTGVETGEQPVLNISSIKEVKATADAAFNLLGSEWRLEDMGGVAADHGEGTLSFPQSGKIAGNGSCNRFFGTAEINGDAIKLGGIGSTRMACPEPVMTQESKYLEALQAAERFEWKDPYLLVYCKGLDKPLRFARLAAAKPAAR